MMQLILCVISIFFQQIPTRRFRISDREPAFYIFKLVPADRFSEILSSNLMPLKKEIYQQNAFGEFLKFRAQLIIQFIDQQVA